MHLTFGGIRPNGSTQPIKMRKLGVNLRQSACRHKQLLPSRQRQIAVADRRKVPKMADLGGDTKMGTEAEDLADYDRI